MRTATPALTLVILLGTLGSRSEAAPTRDPGSTSSAAAAQAVRIRRPLDVSAMTPAETLWYARALAGMAASNVLINNTMTSGDVYQVGRDGGNYVEALILVFRATGDRQFLDRAYDLTQLAKTGLRDAWLDGTTDGYTDWLWLADPTNATFYGKDTDWLDESIVSGNVALWTFEFNRNRALDPKFGAAADFWLDWLQNQFLAKWYARAGGAMAAWDTPYAAFYKPDTEPRSANWRLAYYLWKLTGNTFYRDRAEEIRLQLVASLQVNPAHPMAYRWAKELDYTTANWQTINYANYVARVYVEMNLEGVPFFSSPTTMKLLAGTFRDVVYAGSMPALTTMTNDLNGGGSTTFAPYAFNGFSPWDTTGFLATLANAAITGAGNYAGGGLSKAARNDVFISSYALMALSPMGTTPTTVDRFDALSLGDGTVRIEWVLSPSAASGVTNLYRLSADGVQRFRVNAAPVSGWGAHVLVDTPPADQAVVTYELTELATGGEETIARTQVSMTARPKPMTLEPSEPNPFTTSTLVQLDVPRPEHVRLAIYDASGRLVRVLAEGDLAPGRYARAWDGRDQHGRSVPSGYYYVAAVAGPERLIRGVARVR